MDLLQVSSKVETQKDFNDVQTAYCSDFLSCGDQTLGMGPGERRRRGQRNDRSGELPMSPAIGTSRPDNKAMTLGACGWEIKFAAKATGIPGKPGGH